MSEFKAKMHQIQFRLGLHHQRPRWGWGILQRSPLILAGFKVNTSNGREKRERNGWGNGRGGVEIWTELEKGGREGKESRKGPGKEHPLVSAYTP